MATFAVVALGTRKAGMHVRCGGVDTDPGAALVWWRWPCDGTGSAPSRISRLTGLAPLAGPPEAVVVHVMVTLDPTGAWVPAAGDVDSTTAAAGGFGCESV